MNFLVSSINTCLFTGKISRAPGTVGSIFALIIWWIFSPAISSMLILLVLITLLSYYTISIVLKDTDDKDPQYIVIDEAIGMWISVLFISTNDFLNIFLAFICFRLLDIIKPSIIYRIQYIKGPGGILADDIIAGIFTCLVFAGITSI